jgi:hypothetical protein
MVPSVRRPCLFVRPVVPGLSAVGDLPGPRAVRVRRAGAPGRAPAEVLGMACRRRGARRRDGRGMGRRPFPAGRGDLGALVPGSAGGTRLRPGEVPRRGGRPAARRAGARLLARTADPGPGAPGRFGSSRCDARGVFAPRASARAGPPGRRRPYHRGHGERVRAGPAGCRSHGGGAAHGRARRVLASGSDPGRGSFGAPYTRRWARVRVCGCPGERFLGSRCQPRAKRPT